MFSAKGTSLQSCSPSCFCRAIQIDRLLLYILRWWWQSLCQNIHRQTCPVCFLRSILLLIFYNSTTFWYDLICLNWQSYGWNVTIKNFRSIYNNFYGIKTFMGMRWRWRGLQSYNWAYKDLCIISYKKGLCHFTQSLFERILISLYWLQLYSSDKFLLYYCI